MSADGSLRGLTVGIPATRRATETARLVERWGGNPLVGPTVREVTAADPAPVVEATRRAIDAPLRWSVHLTGVGTSRWFALADQAGLLDALLGKLSATGLIARGPKAKAALARVDLRPVWIPESETSDEIAEFLSARLSGGEAVAVQLHGDPVPALAEAITSGGAELIAVQSYSWELPEDTRPAEQLIRSILDGNVHALVVTSAPQARFLARIADQNGVQDELLDRLREQVFLAAVGTVAASGLEELGLQADLIARPARMGTLVRALAESRSRVEAKAGLS